MMSVSKVSCAARDRSGAKDNDTETHADRTDRTDPIGPTT